MRTFFFSSLLFFSFHFGYIHTARNFFSDVHFFPLLFALIVFQWVGALNRFVARRYELGLILFPFYIYYIFAYKCLYRIGFCTVQVHRVQCEKKHIPYVLQLTHTNCYRAFWVVFFTQTVGETLFVHCEYAIWPKVWTIATEAQKKIHIIPHIENETEKPHQQPKWVRSNTKLTLLILPKYEGKNI